MVTSFSIHNLGWCRIQSIPPPITTTLRLEDRTVELLLAPGHQGAALYFELIHGFNQSQTMRNVPNGRPASRREAATDVIAAAQAQGTVQPWTHPSFIDVIANPQRDRQIRASYQPDEVQFHDRALCVPRRWQSTSAPFFTLSCQRTAAPPKRSHLPKPRLLHSQSWLHHAYRSAANQL